MSGTSCPNSDELTAYAVGDLPEDSVQTLANHIDTCASCQAALTTLDDLQDAWTRRVRQAAGDLLASEPECEEAIVRTWDAVGKLVSSDGSSASMTMTTVPEQLGEYRLMEQLGEGGMGVVYKAFHVKLQRAVALKVLPSRHTENAQTVARFEREMATVGQLDHPNIVGAYDARELDGQRFLVMELVDGVNLAELVKRCGPLPVSDACELTRQIALGLDHAHRRGLVHRDIKPSNVMLASDGRAKILDFGLALLKVEQPTEGDMTVVGLAMGTPDYMAPEQASDSHQVDIRADLYSLGCTLYHLLAGRPPYAGTKYKSRFDKMMAHVHDPVPPIQQFRPEIPQAVIEMLERLLAKDPKARFSEPAEVVDAAGKLTGNCDLASLLTRVGQVPQARRSAGDPSVPPEGSRASRPEDTRSDRSAKTRGHEISARLNVGNFGCGIVVAVACLLIAAVPVTWYGLKPFLTSDFDTPLADAQLAVDEDRAPAPDDTPDPIPIRTEQAADVEPDLAAKVNRETSAATASAPELAGRSRTEVYPIPSDSAIAPADTMERGAESATAQVEYHTLAAIARDAHAEAVKQEIANRRKHLETYFEARARNRTFRDRHHYANLAMRDAEVQKAKEEKITKYFQSAMRGDATEGLNWLLNELSGPILTLRYSADQRLLKEFDFPLDSDAVYHIRLADRGSRGHTVVFRAADPKPLQTDWPVGLRGPEFEDIRDQFENARDNLLKQLAELARDEQLPFETGKAAVKAVDALFTALEQVYPKERRQDPNTFVEYNTAKRYMRSLLAGVLGAIETGDRRLLNGSYKFEGRSVLDLLNHMCQNGLEFASPDVRDEGTYRILFEAMRTIYLQLTEEEAIPSAPVRQLE